jgi:hypothetical protein
MKAITSKKTLKEQIITEDQWKDIVARGWRARYNVRDIPNKPLKIVPSVVEKPEKEPVKKTKTKKSNG